MFKKTVFILLALITLFSCKSTHLDQIVDEDFVVHGWTMEKDIILRFIDVFDNNQNNWIVEKNETQEWFFRKGRYHLINRDKESIIWQSKEFELKEDENFAIQINLTFQWNTNGEAYIIYGEDKFNTCFYYMKLDYKESLVYLGKIVNGKQEQEIQIRGNVKSMGEQNRIAIIKYGNELKFNVNDNFVYTKNFEPFFGKGIGIGCGGEQNISFSLFFVNQQKSQNPNFVPFLP